MITRLQVRNFKSLKNIDVTLASLNVLVGPNMSGKSNIVDVFSFLHQVFFPQSGMQGIWYALSQRGGINEILWKGGDEKLLVLALEGVDPWDASTRFRYELQLIAGAGDFVGVQSERLTLSRDGKDSELIVQEQGFNKLKNADGKEVGSVGSTGVSALQYAMPGWDGLRLAEWVKLWRFHHLVPAAMKQPTQMSLGQVLMPSGENLSAWLMWLQTHSQDSFARVNEVLHDLFPDVRQVRNIPMPDGRVQLQALENGLRRPTAMWQASDGFLVLTALLSLIYVPPELSGTLFCIEEPENHLHPRLLSTLVQLLRQARREVLNSKGSPAQIVMSTQSPYLVDQFSLDEIIWVEKKNGETRVDRPSEKQHLKKLIEDKELGLGDLMYTGVLGQGK